MKFITSLSRVLIIASGLFFSQNTIVAQTKSPNLPSSCVASPESITIVQPNATSINIIGKGNLNNHWTETIDGYTIIRNTAGNYEYANKQNGNLVPSGVLASDLASRTLAETTFTATLSKSLKPTLSPLKRSILSQVNAQLQNKTFPTTGNINVLALLIDYPDLQNVIPKSGFDSLLYGANYRSGDGSFKAFYETSSGGQLTVTVDVKGWYRATNNFQYYAADSGYDRAADLVREAVDAAEVAGTNYSLYDNDSDGDVDGILTVHSGPGAEIGSQSGLYVWSHRWVMSGGNTGAAFYDGVSINDYMINPETRSATNNSISGIGVFCHEFGHNLGLPDLYDTDNANGGSEGIGNWCLMAGGAYSGSSNRPSGFSAWCKEDLNWDTPQILTLGQTGNYTLDPASTNQDEFYRINTPLSNEYFLIENRQLVGRDSDLPGHGLAIWHINTTKTNSFGNRVNADENLKGVDLEEADGNDDLDNEVNRGDRGDLFPGTSNRTAFDDNTTPSAQNYLLGNTGFEIRNIVETVGGPINFSFGQAPGPPCAVSTTLTMNSGSFDDGSGLGLDYVNGQTCAWLITPTTGTVTLSFSAFDIEPINDTITVYDGININAPLLGRFSGNSIPANLTSSSNSMYVQFKSNATISAPGFDASYTVNSSSTPCLGSTTLTAANGNFTDGSGTSNYNNNQNCSWLIQPAGAASITFGLTSLATEIGTDVITVYDGPSAASPVLGSFSGTNNLNTFTSNTGSIFVTFITNGTITDQGFDAFYTSSSSSAGCSGATTLTAISGSFSDGSLNNNYNNNQFCSWLIQPPSGTIILSFSTFATETSNDQVLVFDGIDNTAPQIGNFSGTSIPANLTSTSNALYLEFRTNGTVTDLGWDASYTSSVTCSGITNLTAVSGNIDDGSGTANYQDNLSCSWLIEPARAGSVTATFNTLGINSSGDTLYFYDGMNNSAPLITKITGNTIPPSVTASTGKMFVEFITNGSVNDIGWDFNYTSVILPTCSGLTTLTATTGTISDGSGASNYDNNLNCTWLIQPAGNPLVINFTMTSVDIAGTFFGNGDRLLVYDGTDNTGTFLGFYFGTNLGTTIRAFSGSMFFEFTSDASNTGQGWEGTYNMPLTYCQPNTTFTANNGIFTDGSPLNQNYSDNTNCEWLIQPATPNVAVLLQLSQFSTEALNDTLTVYDGATTSDPILGTFSGNNPTIPILLSTGGSMLLTFKTNGVFTSTGWRANYNIQAIPGCNGTTSLTAASGTFDDGTNASANYVPNLNCSWLIQPAGASLVTLNFNRFNTQNNADFVSAYDGPNSSSPLIGTYSGNTIPPAINSSGNSLFVEFNSNGFFQGTGWEANYSSTNAQCFSNRSVTRFNGNIEDGSGTANYQDNLSCSWVIEPPLATSVSATFNTFNVLSPGDTLFIYDGNSSAANQLAAYTGTTIPPAVTSTAGEMFVEFITDGAVNGSGWDFDYTTTLSVSCAGTTTLTAPSATFDDGSSITANYDNNLSCEWLIQPTGNPVAINFSLNRINLIGNQFTGDRIQVYDNASGTGFAIGNYSRTNLGGISTSYTGVMLVRFTTNASNTSTGWEGTYNSSSTYCLPNTTFTGNNGIFTDGSPFGQNYLDNTNCAWLIQPTAPNVAVRLNFGAFDTETTSDTVTVYDGATTAAPILGTFSGNTTPPAITSSGGDMLVTFKSNGSTTASGWRAGYNTQQIPACSGTTTLIAANGTFDDGSIPSANYVSNSNCSWLIAPTGALNIDLTFPRFNTEAGSDIVNIYDGNSNTAPLLGSYSGSTLPSVTSSSGGTMFVEFITDANFNLTGWEANYTSFNTVNIDAPKDTVYVNAGIGSTNTLNLFSNVAWSVSDNATWLVATPVNGRGNATINLLAIQVNIGPERVAELIIDATLTNDADTVIVIQRTSGRFLTTAPDTLYFAGNAAPNQTATINSNVSWTLTPDQAWIMATPSAGSNNGSSSIMVQNNSSNQVRTSFVLATGTLGAANDTIWIVQDTAATNNNPTLSLDKMNITLAQAMGSSDVFTVNSTTSWQTTSGAAWLTVTNPAITNDTQSVTVTANSMNLAPLPRATYVAVQDVAGTLFDTVFVFQAGTAPILIGAPDTVLLGATSGSSGVLNVGSTGIWTGVAGDPWISLSQNTGTGITTVNLTTNSANIGNSRLFSFVALADVANGLTDTIIVIQDTVTTGLVTTPDTLRLGSAVGSSGSFNVSTSLTWTATPSASWITATPNNGIGSVSVSATAAANPGITDRIAYIEVASTGGALNTDTVWVIQEGFVANLAVNPSTINLGFTAGSNKTVNISSNTSWTITNPGSWLSVSSTSGINDQVLTITANSDNLTGTTRTATILVDGIGAVTTSITVNQIDGSSPIFISSKDTVFVENIQGSTGTFSVLSNANSWTLAENTSWLLINPTTGSQTQRITALVATRNVFGATRYANITASSNGFSDFTVVVAQKESDPIFQIAPDSILIGADSSDFAEFNISSNMPNWNISEGATWLTISPENGAFTQRVKATAISRNTSGAQRNAIATISAPPLVPQTIKIVQDTVRTIGIESADFKIDLSVYPNPSNSQVTIQFGKDQLTGKQATIRLFNLIGEEIPVQENFSSKNKIFLNLENQASGIYFLSIELNGKTVNRKLILTD